MAQFVVNYIVSCAWSMTVEASSRDEAQQMVENMPLSDLGRESDEGTVETVDTQKLD